MNYVKMVSIAVTAGLLLSFGGCTKKPSQEELTQLEESKSAAVAAEKKLSELRSQRQELESTLDGKKGELQQLENERNELKDKTGN